jgi:hypothetical protein
MTGKWSGIWLNHSGQAHHGVFFDRDQCGNDGDPGFLALPAAKSSMAQQTWSLSILHERSDLMAEPSLRMQNLHT